MYLTKAEIFSLPVDAFKNIGDLCRAVEARFACGITPETAARIIADYNARQRADLTDD